MAVGATTAAVAVTGELPRVLRDFTIHVCQCTWPRISVCEDADLWRPLLAGMRRVVAADVSTALTRPARMSAISSVGCSGLHSVLFHGAHGIAEATG